MRSAPYFGWSRHHSAINGVKKRRLNAITLVEPDQFLVSPIHLPKSNFIKTIDFVFFLVKPMVIANTYLDADLSLANNFQYAVMGRYNPSVRYVPLEVDAIKKYVVKEIRENWKWTPDGDSNIFRSFTILLYKAGEQSLLLEVQCRIYISIPNWALQALTDSSEFFLYIKTINGYLIFIILYV